MEETMKFLLFASIILNCIFAAHIHSKEEVRIIKSPPEVLEHGGDEYMMVFDDFPKNQEFIISYSRVIQKDFGKYKPLDKIKIDDQGVLTVNGKKRALHYCVSYECIAPGESIKYKYTTLDGKVIAETTFIPKPIRKKSKQGTFWIKAELTSFFPTIYEISYEGLELNEIIQSCDISGNEIMESENWYNPKDCYLHMPGVLDKSGGVFHMQKTRRKNDDNVILSLKWGDDIIKQILKALNSYIEISLDDETITLYTEVIAD